jgi:Ras-related protein Rab-7A
MHRYMTGKYTSQYRATVGADFLSTNISHHGKNYSLQVWDTAGQERFQSIGSAFYRGSDCCVIVYDITSQKSFDSIENWKQEFIEQGGVKDPTKFPFVIIGNKSDKEDEREVTKSKAELWSQNNGEHPFFETSAKDDQGVKEAFESITGLAADQIKEEEM